MTTDKNANTNPAAQRALQVRTNLKAGRIATNHNQTLRVRTNLKAGVLSPNHTETLAVR